MDTYPIEPPRIQLEQLDAPTFEVTLAKHSDFWLLPLEEGRHGWSTSYEYPGPRFWERREHTVKGQAWVHDKLCLETQARHFDTNGDLAYTNTVFQGIDRGYIRRYATIYSDPHGSRLSTWKDNGFEDAWGHDPGTPLHIVDAGRWRWLDETHFVEATVPENTWGTNPNGAGLWELTIGDRVHRCLRVLEPEVSAEGIMVETFVTEAGHTVLARRYNGTRWHYGQGKSLIDGVPHEWTDVLPDAPRLYYRQPDGTDICFVLWDFSIPNTAL